jgi:hypothetical protein
MIIKYIYLEMNKKFNCNFCNYSTDIKCNFEKHINTSKHIYNTTNEYDENDNENNNKLSCYKCSKNFNHRTTLWRHKKMCLSDSEKKSDSEYNSLSDDDEYENDDYEYDDVENDEKSETDYENNYESESDDEFEEEMKQGSAKGLHKIIKMLIKENSEFKDTIMQQQQQQNETNKIMMELVKSNPNPNPNSTMTSTTNGITNGNNNVNNLVINNSNTTNNNFNLNFFLNETCKDAMNIEEFMDSIEITIPDLKRLGKCGYVEALSNLLITHLRSIEYTRRPMHCSDVKRETIYIRDKHKWEKENEEKKRLNKFLLGVTRMNTIALQDIYQKKYPHCLTNHKSKEHKEYGEIAYNAFGGSKGDADKLNKYIIKNLIKEIKIEKYLPQIV